MNSDVVPALHIGTRLRLLRIRRGMEMRELAKKAGINRTTLSFIERDKRMPRINDFVAIITVLGVSPHEMLCGSENWNPEGVCI